MPTTQLQFRRGNTAQTSVFTGAIGEVTVDTDRKTLTVHDGVTVGGTYVATNIQLTSAYDKANAANVLAQAGFNQANSGFNKANSANVLAQNAYDASNTVNVYANSAYSTANSAQANTVITQGVDSTQNTWIGSNAVFSQASYDKANSANLLAQGSFDQGNTNTTVLTSAYNFANSVNTYAYSSNVYLSGLISTANTDMKAYVDQANTGLKSYVDQANTGLKSYVDQANTGLKSYVDQSNTGMASFVVSSNTAMKAYVDQANTGLKSYVDQANTGMASYVVSSNTGLKSYGDATYFTKSGGTISGDVTISGNNNLTITGNLIVQGTTSTSNTTVFEINDPLLLLGIGNYYSDTLDIGFASHYNDGANAHTGLFRDYATKEYYLFKGYTPDIDANNNINIAHPSFAYSNVWADYVKTTGVVTSNIASSASQDLKIGPIGKQTTIVSASGVIEPYSYMRGGNYGGNQIDVTSVGFGTQIKGLYEGVDIRVSTDGSGGNVSSFNPNGTLTVSGKVTSNGLNLNDFSQAAFNKANTNAADIVITQGVDSTQNTNITTATNLAQGAFTSANTRANSFSGTTGSATPSGGSITFTSTNGITISGTSSTLTINSPQDLQSTASPTFKSISFANTATGNRTVVQSTTASTAQTAIDTWSTSTYRTAKYIVSMSSGANYHAIELLIIHNGTTPTIVQYAEVIIGSSLATFDASIASTTLTLLANPATTSSITYNLLRDNIGA